ncbi:MAG: hypothetical protein KVP17_002688 [Porospora cf. gigantea B]|uniref:uncharacterized protein n=1 Tax=Porospora cf. gigantea B TaxID=2853592 RepID=UPI003571BB91|nr:MAG: hypothetical protein KVP17_002688 [Porospora cf. gigantea B]
MSNRVYVGNLSFKVSWQELKDHMRTAGEVVFAEVPQDQASRSKGYGIVEYKTAEEARAAIETLHDTEIFERKIFVREDRESGRREQRGEYREYQPREPREPREPQNTVKGAMSVMEVMDGLIVVIVVIAVIAVIVVIAANAPDPCRVFVGNLPWRTTWQDLKDTFRTAGFIQRSDVFRGPDGRSKGIGIVVFSTQEEANAAVQEYDGYELQGRQITCKIDEGSSNYRSRN